MDRKTDSQEEIVFVFVCVWHCTQKKSLSKFIVKIEHVCQFSAIQWRMRLFLNCAPIIVFVSSKEKIKSTTRLLFPFMGYVEVIRISIGIYIQRPDCSTSIFSAR